jgi:hypothetical protein
LPGSEPGPGRRWPARHLLPPVALLVAALGLWLGGGRPISCGGALESPETQVRKALGAQDRAHLDDLYGAKDGTADLTSLRYAEVVSSFEGARATVVALVEATGRVTWRDQSTELTYLGREKSRLRACSTSVWCADGEQFPRLRGVLLLLLRREAAFDAGGSAAYAGLVSEGYRDQGLSKQDLLGRLAREPRSAVPRRQRILAWQIRVDRERAEVGEDYLVEVAGQTPRQQRARYTLVLEGDGWVFSSGL